MPHPGMHGNSSGPRLIAWELTRRCPLKCVHCRAKATMDPIHGEFSTDECKKVLDNVAAFSSPIMILTGGEPLLRDDILEIAEYGNSLGLRMVLATCGTLMTPEMAQNLVDAGIMRISLSIDGATSDTHDKFRGEQGAYEAVMRAIEYAKAVNLPFQINTTVTKTNLHEVSDILDLAIEKGAVAFHPFLLVPTGRGELMKDRELDPEEYEEALEWIYERSTSSPIEFKPTCAPHYYRIFRQKEKAQGRSVTPQTHGMAAMTKGCLGGQGFAFVSNVGELQICGFLDVKCGDLRASNYNFQKNWESNPVFLQIRAQDDYDGRCGYCEYRNVCGGCRARAYAMTENYLGEEPYCVYEPQRADPRAQSTES
jgi:AdoMet-dependent heme synthase